MKGGILAGMIITGVLVAAVSVVTGAGALMAWALALNGFMGQERAVNTSLVVMGVLGIGSAILSIALSVGGVHLLAGRKNWNPIGASALSVVVFSLVVAGLHLAAVMISAVVASELRTGR